MEYTPLGSKIFLGFLFGLKEEDINEKIINNDRIRLFIESEEKEYYLRGGSVRHYGDDDESKGKTYYLNSTAIVKEKSESEKEN